MDINSQRNREYWDRIASQALEKFETQFLLRDIDGDAAAFVSLEQAALYVLGDAFELRMVQETEKAWMVAKYAKVLAGEALARHKFQDYQYVHLLDAAGQRLFELKGAANCHAYLVVADYLLGRDFSFYDFDDAAREFFSELVKQQASAVKSYFDMWWYVYAVAGQTRLYVNSYEMLLGAETDSRADWKNKSKVTYYWASALSGNETLLKLACGPVAKNYQKSRAWYAISASYPWWERLGWAEAHSQLLRRIDRDYVLTDLKGVD